MALPRLINIIQQHFMSPDQIKAGFPKEIPFPQELQQLCDWTSENSYPISGYFRLRADDGKGISYWFGFPNVTSRFGIFGLGPDGSLYAIWDDGQGGYPVVHLGSEGQNNMVLASDFIEFLRLLAVGYGELGFEELSQPPCDVEQNAIFKAWVENQFTTSIPTVGTDITLPAQTRHPNFQEWINDVLEKFS